MPIRSDPKNVAWVVEHKLCNSCGACFVVCGANAINFKETCIGNIVPHVLKDKCNDCGLCLKVCSGLSFCSTLVDKLPCDPFAGSALATYVGRAKDDQIFSNAQSGGIVSGLLCYAIGSKLADAAVTVTMGWGNPPRPIVQMAQTVADIKQAQKSKYVSVPITSILKEIKRDNKKIIFVGLPCHIHALWNLCQLDPSLEKNIVLTIGLLCDGTLANGAIDYLLEHSHMEGHGECNLSYKDKQYGGYPGNIRLHAKDGCAETVSSGVRMKLKKYYTPLRCRICFDKMNVFCDIAVGDPWGIKDADHNMGESACAIRTKRGMDFSQNACAHLKLRELNYSQIVAGQRIDDKRKEFHEYIRLWEREKLPVPGYLALIRDKTGGQQLHAERQARAKFRLALRMSAHKSKADVMLYVKRRLLKKNGIMRFLNALKVNKNRE